MCLAPRQTPSPHAQAAFVAGRLQSFASQWRDPQLGASRWVLDALKGIPIQRRDDLPGWTSRLPFDSLKLLGGNQDKIRAAQTTLDEYLAMGSVELVPLDGHEDEGLYQQFFTVPKKETQDASASTTEWRGCLNCKPLNEQLIIDSFKMEGLHTVRELARRDDLAETIDIAKAYPHLPVREEDRPLLRFMWRGVRYQFRAMPFGLSTAPRIWTKVMRPIVALIRRLGVRCVIYIDDLLLLAEDRATFARHAELIRRVFLKYGLVWSEKKDNLDEPKHCARFLGCMIDTRRMQFLIPRDRIRGIKQAAIKILRLDSEDRLSIRDLAGFVGKAQATTAAVVYARYKSRHLLHLKNAAFASRPSWAARLSLTKEAKEELEWWIGFTSEWNGKAVIAKEPKHHLQTDASRTGWGAWDLKTGRQLAGFFETKWGRRSSNRRELTTIVYAILAFADLYAGSVVEVETDNTTSMAYINHLGGPSRDLTDIVRPLFDWAMKTKTTIVARHIAGKKNVVADALSRIRRDRLGFSLSSQLFDKIEALWGPHSVDMFASRANARLSRFWTLDPDPAADATDAMRQRWGRERGYAHPPFAMIGRLLRKARRDRATLTLVAPVWTAQPWWPVLLRMCIDTPRLLPSVAGTFQASTPSQTTPFQQGAVWVSAAFRISGEPSIAKAFHTPPLSEWCSL